MGLTVNELDSQKKSQSFSSSRAAKCSCRCSRARPNSEDKIQNMVVGCISDCNFWSHPHQKKKPKEREKGKMFVARVRSIFVCLTSAALVNGN